VEIFKYPHFVKELIHFNSDTNMIELYKQCILNYRLIVITIILIMTFYTTLSLANHNALPMSAVRANAKSYSIALKHTLDCFLKHRGHGFL